jgi:predicted nuclease of predicted toxin-antitoxin system
MDGRRGRAKALNVRLIRWYLDKDSESHSLADGLRRAGYTVFRTGDVGNARAPDPVQLEYATVNNLAIVTANSKDYLLLHAQWLTEGREHAGIAIRVQGLGIGEDLRRLLRLGGEITSEQMCGSVQFLSRWRTPLE